MNLATSLILEPGFILGYLDGWQKQLHCVNEYRICSALFCNHLILKLFAVCKEQTGFLNRMVWGIECLLSGTGAKSRIL